MIKSMTGYGSAKGVSGRLEIAVEVKSVNNRYLDCSIKIPRVYAAFEETLKAVVQKHISRGKIDVFINIDSSNANDIEIKINEPLAQAYVAALRSLASMFGLSDNISATDLSRYPDILQAEKQEADLEQVCADICAVLEDALAGFDAMRLREGEKMHGDIMARVGEIERLSNLVEELSPRTVAEYRKKLEARIRDILQTADIDEARILTEAALFADKTAVNEEIVRLRSHISQLREMMAANEPIGRKIDFLIQEFNREANTIGSKGNDAEMAKSVIDMKAEIEKIREQAQNVE